MGVKVSNDISSESTHQIHSPKLMPSPRKGICQIVKRIVKFGIFDIFVLFNIVVDGDDYNYR